jgi:hypothetical protein
MEDNTEYYWDAMINCELCLKKMEKPFCDEFGCKSFNNFKIKLEEKRSELFD